MKCGQNAQQSCLSTIGQSKGFDIIIQCKRFLAKKNYKSKIYNKKYLVTENKFRQLKIEVNS